MPGDPIDLNDLKLITEAITPAVKLAVSEAAGKLLTTIKEQANDVKTDLQTNREAVKEELKTHRFDMNIRLDQQDVQTKDIDNRLKKIEKTQSKALIIWGVLVWIGVNGIKAGWAWLALQAAKLFPPHP